MSTELEVGPVDYLVIEFPGNKMTGEALPILADLAGRAQSAPLSGPGSAGRVQLPGSNL